MPKRLELRQLEVEGRRELLLHRGGGAERLGDGQAQLDLTQGLLPAVQACLPVRERGEVRLRRGKGAGVRLLLSGKRRPERAEGRIRAGGGRVLTNERIVRVEPGRSGGDRLAGARGAAF